jgi:Tfp pilus assembly protein PilF
MSLIDQALKAAQREKSRLDEESGRAVAPVLVRLRTQPRPRIHRDHLMLAAGVVVTIVAAVLWINSTREAPLPDVPPVTSTILTEAIASDSVRLQGAAASVAQPPIVDTTRVAAAIPPRAIETRVGDPASVTNEIPDVVDERAPADNQSENDVVERNRDEPLPEPAGTLRISVEQPRNTTASQLFAEAIAAHRAQEFARAKQLYERVLARAPSDADALNNLGVILSMEREHDRAYALLRRAVTVAPQNAGAWSNLGNLLKEQGKASEAIMAFRQALAIDPGHQGAGVGLAQQYLATSALSQARELLETVLRANATLAEAHYTLGQVLEQQGDRAGAVASYNRFISVAPERLSAHVELVRHRVDLLSAGR